jgi:hypothetical protein
MTIPGSPWKVGRVLLVAMVLGGCASAGSGSAVRLWTVLDVRGEEAEIPDTVGEVSALAAREESATTELLRAEADSLLVVRGYRKDEDSPVDWHFLWTVLDPIGAADAPRDPRTLAAYPSSWDGNLASRVRRASWRRAPGSGSSLQLEVLQFGVAQWTGVVRWEGRPDEEALRVGVRHLVDQLPDREEAPRTFTRLTPDEVLHYYTSECATGPVVASRLPYPVRFEPLELRYHRGGGVVEWDDTVTSYRHSDPALLPAVRDLVHRAREPVPTGSHSRPQPTDRDLWTNVTLAAPYVDDVGGRRYVYAKLSGDSRGYRVEESGTLDDRGWQRFREDREAHRKLLAAFYGAR